MAIATLFAFILFLFTVAAAFRGAVAGFRRNYRRAVRGSSDRRSVIARNSR